MTRPVTLQLHFSQSTPSPSHLPADTGVPWAALHDHVPDRSSTTTSSHRPADTGVSWAALHDHVLSLSSRYRGPLGRFARPRPRPVLHDHVLSPPSRYRGLLGRFARPRSLTVQSIQGSPGPLCTTTSQTGTPPRVHLLGANWRSINQYFMFTSVHTKVILDKHTNKQTYIFFFSFKNVDFRVQPTLK